jgi:ABC-type Fe3+ transport system substrate-binding protein
LALTPMVLVMWKDRYEAYTARSPELSLRTIYFAMRAKSGWGRIAGKPEWGVFKFGHTRPDQSNSGLMTLIVLAYSAHRKKSGLTVAEVNSPAFREYLAGFGRGVTGLSISTGNLMKEMTAKGPSGFDALMVYENLAIDYFRSGDTKWGPLQVIYPEENLWNENPYCILNVPWTTKAQQDAAAVFLRFLLSEPIQARALDFGFRPANASVPVKGMDSPFTRFVEYGLRVEVPEMCEVPSAEVVELLQEVWVRHAVPR